MRLGPGQGLIRAAVPLNLPDMADQEQAASQSMYHKMVTI